MKSLKESILSSNKAGILSKIRDNLKYCNNVKEFSKLWTALGLDIDKCHWEYAGGGGYIYKNLNGNHIFCMDTTDPKKYSCIFIYVTLDEIGSVNFDVKKYAKTVAKTLDMTCDYSEGGWYELKFK